VQIGDVTDLDEQGRVQISILLVPASIPLSVIALDSADAAHETPM
jgi:hypothetical protein